MTRTTAETPHAELVAGDWVVRFERRTLVDIRTIVQPDPENERRFATARRVSEINLSLYRTFLQPWVRAFSNDRPAEFIRKCNPGGLSMRLFSDSNPAMRQVGELAEQVRERREPVAKDNPFLQWQGMISDAIVAALDGYRDIRDSTMEQIFLKVYGSPVLQAMVGLGATDEPPRRRPGIEPERIALVEQRIAEIKGRLVEGGLREAAIRSLAYIGMAGQGVDERAFNMLRQLRAEHSDITLDQFKRLFREQFFALLLDRNEALAAIPKMLPADTDEKSKILENIRQVVMASGQLRPEVAERLKEIEALFAAARPSASN